jgi:uncharacterized protein (DUF1330 family)
MVLIGTMNLLNWMCGRNARRVKFTPRRRPSTSATNQNSETGACVSAYVIVDIDIHDPAGYEKYKQQAFDTVEAYGGRYLARGGKTEVFEGAWVPNRLVILEFESIARARAWLNSPEYTPIKVLRQQTAKSNMVVVEGMK